MKTTLNKIREHEPCTDGWKKLLTHLGKTEADDEPVSLLTILDSNGLDDALWCLRAVEGYDKEIRLYAIWCARQVQYLMTDQRSLDALDVTERYANGRATEVELKAASYAARAAAWAAAWAERAAASYAAGAAAGAAARAAEWAASYAANTAWAAAWAAAWAERAAASYAAGAASYAASYAAGAAQEQELRRVIMEIEEKQK